MEKNKKTELNETPYQRALKYIQSGLWDNAHEIVQHIETPEAASIHAYLHRVEGDAGNAAYWYQRAGEPRPRGTLEEELQQLLKKFDVQ